MSKKEDLKAELTKLGIAFDDAAKNADLEALLPAGDAVLNEPEDALDIEVDDPQDVRPQELPLLIKPANGGSWANNEQSEYAKILNAAAYANPTNWAVVKDVEIARLKEIGTNPDAYYKYTGTQRGQNPLTLKRSDSITS